MAFVFRRGPTPRITSVQFRINCLKLLAQVERNHEESVVPSFGRPIVKIVSVGEAAAVPIFGCMHGTATIVGEIVAGTGEKWNPKTQR